MIYYYFNLRGDDISDHWRPKLFCFACNAGLRIVCLIIDNTEPGNLTRIIILIKSKFY